MENCEYNKKGQVEKVKDSKERVNFTNLGLAYKDALNHQKTCSYRKRHCPRKCGIKLYGKDLEAHLPVCVNLEVICPDCEICTYPNREESKSGEDNTGAKHDCFQSLVTEVHKNEKELTQLKKNLGINYDQVNNTCPSNHPMVVHRGLALHLLSNNSDYKPKCIDCGQLELNMSEFYYRCSEWTTCANKFHQLCRMCALINCNPHVLNKNQRVHFHECKLEIHGPNFAGWTCDAYKLPGNNSLCLSGFANNSS